MFGASKKAELALERIAAHEKDCAEERQRSKEWRVDFANKFDGYQSSMGEKLDLYHGQNRDSVRGIYRLLWGMLTTALLMLLSVLGWIAANSLSIQVIPK